MTTPTDDLPAPPPAGQRVNRYGRSGALTPDLHDKIVQVVSAGNYLKTAAQFAGIGSSTLSLWLARGRAAAALRDAHDPDYLYCPECGTDRTLEVRQEHDANQAEEARYQEAMAVWRATPYPDGEAAPAEPIDRAYALLSGCPQCRSGARPTQWELPEQEVRYLAFLEAVTQAETIAEVSAVTHWRRAFTEDWRAARDYLGRKRPEQWAAKTTVSISSEEAEARIERATLEALTALGVDTDSGMGLDDLDDDALPGAEEMD